MSSIDKEIERILEPVAELRKGLEQLKALRQQIDASIARYEQALKILATNSEAPEPEAGKRRLGSRQIVLNVLIESRKWMTRKEIKETLTQLGFHFSDQMVYQRLQELTDAGKIQRAKAPAGSSADLIFAIAGIEAI